MIDCIIFSPPYGIKEMSQEASIKEIQRRLDKGIKGAVMRKDGRCMTGDGKYLIEYSDDQENIGNLKYK